MSIEGIGDLVQRARAEAAAKPDAAPGSERDRLARVAQEFESMLMLQMLKEMRKAGSWDDDERQEGGFGAETMLETIDAELAGHLTRAQGLGLGKQLLDALQKMHPEGETSVDASKDGLPRGTGVPGVTLPAPAIPDTIPPADETKAPLAMPSGQVTSGFGWRADPLHGGARFHRGVDVRAAYGQDVPSVAPGRVVSAGTESGYGETVVIEHAGGVRTRYAHLSSALVAPGDQVREGDVVGRAGRSGRATGTHLHFEVTTAAGDALNPEQFARFKPEGQVADSTRATSSDLEERRR